MDTNIGLFDDNAKNSNVSSMKIFNNSQFGEIRVIIIDGEVWFVGNDVAKALGYQYPKDAIRDNVSHRDKRVIKLSDFQEGGADSLPPHMKGSTIAVINESGLYSLMSKS